MTKIATQAKSAESDDVGMALYVISYGDVFGQELVAEHISNLEGTLAQGAITPSSLSEENFRELLDNLSYTQNDQARLTMLRCLEAGAVENDPHAHKIGETIIPFLDRQETEIRETTARILQKIGPSDITINLVDSLLEARAEQSIRGSYITGGPVHAFVKTDEGKETVREILRAFDRDKVMAILETGKQDPMDEIRDYAVNLIRKYDEVMS